MSKDIAHLRTLAGATRRKVIRDHLAESHNVTFAMDPHAIPMSAQIALADLAKAINWRKSSASSLSLGLAFYVYLSRDVVANNRTVRKASTLQPKASMPFTFGRGAP